MASVRFRDAVAADVPRIVAMYGDDALGATREDVDGPLSPSYLAAFEAIDADPRHRLVVVEDGGDIVATMQLSFLPCLTHRGGERAQIEAVRVAGDRRGSGLGGQVIEWAVEEARAHGCRVVQLMTDAQRPDAHRFYASLGFEPTHVGMKLDLR
jgi:GNAT superfamily N-acetyltransferase